ncbi:16S rRNA (cytidine(1402)-2'-O)-methyltransferase [Chitinibacteraceae bacterium HSL-7]
MHNAPFVITKPALYVVATPIGNLKDVTVRALAVLEQADVVAAEDTRVTGQLLRGLGLHAQQLLSVREHNERAMCDRIIERLAEGQAIAIVSDAGTPAISDPGAVLVAAVHAAGFPVVPVPGASALTAALSVAGMTAPHSLFYGFLPPKGKQRRDAIESLKDHAFQLVFYEAPHRIVEMLADLRDVLGASRQVLMAREVTKTFETIRRTTLGDLCDFVEQDSNQQRGEFVLVVEGAAESAGMGDGDEAQHDSVLVPLVEELPVKQAVAIAQRITGAPRNQLYARALALKQSAND